MRDTHFALSAGGLQAGEVNAFVARCDALAETLKTSQQDVKGVYQAYERILREMRTNQLRTDVINKVFKTIVAPLYKVSETQFDKTYNGVIELRRRWTLPTSPSRLASRRPGRRRRTRGHS